MKFYFGRLGNTWERGRREPLAVGGEGKAVLACPGGVGNLARVAAAFSGGIVEHAEAFYQLFSVGGESPARPLCESAAGCAPFQRDPFAGKFFAARSFRGFASSWPAESAEQGPLATGRNAWYSWAILLYILGNLRLCHVEPILRKS